jgi:hypothetical protein
MNARLPAILALALGATLLTGSVAAGAGRTVALGVATPDRASLAELDRFSETIGRRPAIWVVWSQWGLPGTQRFPMEVARGLAERGVTPMIWWEPVDPRDLSLPTYARHRTIIQGRHDAYIREFAGDAKAFGRPVLLRFAHEANGRYFPWSIHRFDNNAKTYVRAWRHVRGIFREVGATNVKFVWSVAKERCPGGCNPYRKIYPGHQHVDVMGVSAHNWGAMKKWVPKIRSAQRATRLLARMSPRPIIIAESGSSPLGGDKAAWIRNGYRKVYRKLPQVSAIVYLNADLRDVGHPDWSIASPTAALEAYAKVASLPQFSGGLRVTAKR